FESGHLHQVPRERKKNSGARWAPRSSLTTAYEILEKPERLHREGAFGGPRSAIRGQARKGGRWMPGRQEAKKGVASCEKPRGAASRPRAADARMGEPPWGNAHGSPPESIGRRGEPGELKHLSTPRRRHQQRFPK